MENSSFLPNPLTSPALMVLASTAAESSRENQRIQHQFSPQSVEKELPTPYTSSSYPMFRQGEHFPPLYTPIHMPFVQPTVGPISRSGGGAFRPLSQSDERDYHHSAFLPTKRSKPDESFDSRSSPDSKENGELGLDSPAAKDGPLSPNSITYELSSETFSESGESQGRSTPDGEGRSLRRQRKRAVVDGQFPCCPVCGITLRVGEVESHFAAEMEKLDRISKNKRALSRESTPQGRKLIPSPSCSTSLRRGKDSPGADIASQSRLETYLRVKSNRQARLTAKTRNKKKRSQEETVCPVCTERVFGCPEELTEHVEQCLKRMQHENEDTVVDVEGDVQYEEYTWAGQTRIRATSMLEGGFKGSGFKTACKRDDDDDVNLDVDGDDSDLYGKPQYSEKDIIPCSMEDPTEQKERQALRGAYLRTEMNSDVHSSDTERNRWASEENDESAHVSGESGHSNEKDDIEESKTEIIESLKIKIKTQSKLVKTVDKYKCLICMEPYTIPLTSIQCWHVHCEECWLRTLGAKKLCPQCNMITSPSDLRRIYF